MAPPLKVSGSSDAARADSLRRLSSDYRAALAQETELGARQREAQGHVEQNRGFGPKLFSFGLTHNAKKRGWEENLSSATHALEKTRQRLRALEGELVGMLSPEVAKSGMTEAVRAEARKALTGDLAAALANRSSPLHQAVAKQVGSTGAAGAGNTGWVP
jgi:hypothetical protein